MKNKCALSFRIFFAPLFFWGCIEASVDVNLDFGVRNDSLHWTISGGRKGPNILSELKWDNIQSLDGALGVHANVWAHCWFLLNANLGKIYKGENVDLDFHGNNRTGKFSESHSSAHKGFVLDLEGQFEVINPFRYGKMSTLVGLGYHKLHLSIVDGWANHIDYDAFKRPIKGLDSRYSALFWGPYAGVECSIPLHPFLLKFGYTGTLAYYYAKGFWNLRKDFDGNFIHTANNGYGNTFNMELEYPLLPGLDISFIALGRYFWAKGGRDTTRFHTEGGEQLMSTTKLNEVKWTDYAFYLSITYSFCNNPQIRTSSREKIRRLLN